jgi:hypothetical protein
MDFIGWTHIGTSHAKPEMKFDNPAKKSAGAGDIDLCADNATMRGMRVPKSPSEPDISWIFRF